MDSLRLSPPLAQMAAITLPRLSIRAGAQLTITELRGSSGFRADPTFALLPSPNRSVQHEGWRAAWTRPDGWLLFEPADEATARRTFAEAHGNGLCRRVDLSHGLSRVTLLGPAARELLAQGTPLDLRPAVFGPGCCARTRCADFTILLDHGPDGFDVYVDASLAEAFWNWLTDAAETLGS